MLNMLIAIMGDTFEQAIENQDLNSIKTKIEVMSEVADSIHDESSDTDDKHFLFVVTPDETE